MQPRRDESRSSLHLILIAIPEGSNSLAFVLASQAQVHRRENGQHRQIYEGGTEQQDARHDDEQAKIERMADERIGTIDRQDTFPLGAVKLSPGEDDEERSRRCNDEARQPEWPQVEAPADKRFKRSVGSPPDGIDARQFRLKPTREQLDRQRCPIHLREQKHEERPETSH